MLVKVPVMYMWVPFMYQLLGGAYKLEKEMDRDIRRCGFHHVVSAMTFPIGKQDFVLSTL